MLTVEDRPTGCGGPQLLTKAHVAVEAFPSHETQRLAQERTKSQVPRARTVTGGRTTGIVGMLGP